MVFGPLTMLSLTLGCGASPAGTAPAPAETVTTGDTAVQPHAQSAAAPAPAPEPEAPEAAQPDRAAPPADGRPAGDARTPQGVPRVHVAEPAVGPAYHPELVRRVIRSHIEEVRRCAEEDPERHICNGGIELRFTIDAEGALQDPGMAARGSDAPLTPALRECLERAMATWRFPAPAAGTLQVRYPLLASCSG